ncbi:MAG TPA: LLM class F420-dependent oxidoreductase [Acidimicrobiales bacterium]
MRLGVSFPQPDIGSDPNVIREFAQLAERAGFDYLSTFEHVAGAHKDRFVGVDTGFPDPPCLYDEPFHEPFTLFAFMAGVTSHIDFVTNVLVLPQRQTVLVAKQAAEVAILSGDRLRLGVGIGWNHAEYEALGANFQTRGRRVAEQIVVLRKLWSEPLVTFKGKYHALDRVGIAPLPDQPIPIWMGGGLGPKTLQRIAQLADGWLPMGRAEVDSEIMITMHRYLEAAGREPSSLGIQGGITASGERADWLRAAKRWEQFGATDLNISTGFGTGLTALQGLERAAEIREVLVDELGY